MDEMTSGSDTRRARTLDGAELAFDLAAELETLRTEPGYADFGRASKTLARSGPLRVVLVAARAGTEVGAREADGPVAVSVLAGRVAGSRGGPALALPAGHLAWLGAGGPWQVRVEEDAALLLAVAGDDVTEPAP